MLELRDLTKTYGGRTVLAGLSHRFESGQFIAIMGESGVGKSTLLNLIAGLDAPDSGEVLVDGQPMAALDDDAATRLRRTRMGFIFQAFHVLPHLTLRQNVALPLLLNRDSGARADDMLAAVGLGGRGGDFPRQLSGGELQRVAIARALVGDPPLILADEPTGNLDTQTSDEIMRGFQALNRERGITIVLVTHEPDIAAWSRRLVRLKDGRVLYDGPAGEGLRQLAASHEHLAHAPGQGSDA